jgi:hypothetical protein
MNQFKALSLNSPWGTEEHREKLQSDVRFQVLSAASMKMAVFYDVAPCSLVDVYRRFRGACFLHYQSDESLTYRPDDGRKTQGNFLTSRMTTSLLKRSWFHIVKIFSACCIEAFKHKLCFMWQWWRVSIFYNGQERSCVCKHILLYNLAFL